MHAWVERQGAARASAAIVMALLGVNVAYNLVMLLAGSGPPHTFFAMRLDGMFDDFFRFVEGFPGGRDVLPTIVPGLGSEVWLGGHDAFPIDLASDRPTHLHNPPLTVLFGLVTVRAMRFADPGLVFLALLLLLGWWAWRIARSVGGDRGAWARLLLLSYPTVMAVTRANMFAITCALLLIAATLLVARGRGWLLAALLLAVAVNLRPNAILFAGPLLVTAPAPWRPAAVLAGVAAGLFAAAMAAAHALYPLYGWNSFGAGLAHYYRLYVVEDLGLAYGSSMFGGLKLLLGWHPGLDRVALLPPAALVLAGGAAWWRGRLTPATMTFLVAAVYVTASTVIADYHLLVFLAVPLVLASRGPGAAISPAEAVALVASALMLAPKNEVFVGIVSLQVLLNPLILIGAGAAVVVLSFRPAARHAPAWTGRALARQG